MLARLRHRRPLGFSVLTWAEVLLLAAPLACAAPTEPGACRLVPTRYTASGPDPLSVLEVCR